MRKLLLLPLLLICSLSQAQIRELSLKTGLTSALININYTDANGNTLKYNTKAAQSFYAQLNAQFFHYQNFSLQSGIGVIEKRSEFFYKVPIVGSTDSIELKTDLETRSFFIEFDAKLRLLIPELPRVFPYVLFGPQVVFLNRKTKSIPFDIKDQQVQGVFGIGAEVDLQKLHFFLEYNRFINFQNNFSQNPNYEFRESTNAYLIGLKFLIHPKKK